MCLTNWMYKLWSGNHFLFVLIFFYSFLVHLLFKKMFEGWWINNWQEFFWFCVFEIGLDVKGIIPWKLKSLGISIVCFYKYHIHLSRNIIHSWRLVVLEHVRGIYNFICRLCRIIMNGNWIFDQLYTFHVKIVIFTWYSSSRCCIFFNII